MTDSQFFSSNGPFALGEIASRTHSSLKSGADSSLLITDIASLESASQTDISFLTDRTHLKAFASSRAGACFVSSDLAEQAPEGMAVVMNSNPGLAFAVIASQFYPEPVANGEISTAAHIAPSAQIGESSSVEPGAVIEANARIGPRCIIGANAVIGRNVVLGSGCRIAKNVSISHSVLGNDVTVHPGASLGQDGFGYVSGPAGLHKVPQLGRVIVHDNVEIGANATIDRGTSDDTVIGAGTKIDNLVQIGHNCRIGRFCILCGQSGLAGSVTLGDRVVIGGQVAVSDHCDIATGARVAGKSGVSRPIAAGLDFAGYPARPAEEWRFEQIGLKRLGKEIQKQRQSRKTGPKSS